jgi:hypothetical protein
MKKSQFEILIREVIRETIFTLKLSHLLDKHVK